LVFRTADVSCAPGELASVASSVTDWERVMVIAERELATAQVARALHSLSAEVPVPVLDDARRQALAIELRMQFLSRRLQHTGAVLTERGIPFMLLKGAALGAIADPTFCSRPMNDADILVRQSDVSSATEAIEAAGWSATSDEVLRGLLAGAHHHLPPFLDPQMPGIRIELHVGHLPIDHPFAFDETALWRDARAAPAPFAGALVPSPDHLLLHVAAHFAWQHAMAFGAWRTFRVISMVAQRQDFDWARFSRAAVAARETTACYWTLRLANRLSGIQMPATVLRELEPPTPAWLLDALERHFIATIAVGEFPTSPSVGLSQLLWLAAIRPRWSGHETSRNWDRENRWGQAYGTAANESVLQRFLRHLADYRRWSAFITRTLLT
jgi:hypothetical protein